MRKKYENPFNNRDQKKSGKKKCQIMNEHFIFRGPPPQVNNYSSLKHNFVKKIKNKLFSLIPKSQTRSKHFSWWIFFHGNPQPTTSS
jgi:hypothetical protein